MYKTKILKKKKKKKLNIYINKIKSKNNMV